jgi:predicted nuclease of predicted toxin-antitoxin system
MKFYLDDDSVIRALVAFLRRDGHDVRVPTDFGLAGRKDAVHFRKAILENAVLLSHNYEDFEVLHELLLSGQGHHPGVLLVRKDNDPTKDMKPTDIARAIRNLTAAGAPTVDDCIVLNHWR